MNEAKKNRPVRETKLMSDEIRERLPALYATDGQKDPIVQVKFFSTFSSWTWYAIEFDGDDTFFGLVYGHEAELGYFSLSELESGARSPIQIERDLYFRSKPLSEVRRLHERNGAA